MGMKNTTKVVNLCAWLLICQIPAIIGSLFVRNAMDWYHTLIQPPLTPPDALFGAVWSVLYVLLGISAFLLLNGNWRMHPKLTALLFIQLVLNTMWTPVFFGMQHLLGALMLIIVILAQAIWLAVCAWKERKIAVWLLMPYFGWLGFATYLTAAFWILN